MSTQDAAAKTKKPKRRNKSSGSDAAPSAYDLVGRLASFGLREPWHIPLLMPVSHDDLREPASSIYDLEAVENSRGLIALEIVSGLRTAFGKVPRTILTVRDEVGDEAQATIFGDTKDWNDRLSKLDGRKGHFIAQASRYQGRLTLTINEIVDRGWVGAMRPRYQGKPRYMPAEKVLEKVVAALAVQLPHAASALRSQVEHLASEGDLVAAAGLPGWTLEQILEELHLPASPAMGLRAREAIMRIAAFVAITRSHEHVINRATVRPIALRTTQERARQVPFEPTFEQLEVIREIAIDLGCSRAMKRLLQADVGFGKSVPMLVIAAAVVDAGGRVSIMAPSTPLAEQLHREFSTWFPDLTSRLVTGELAERVLTADRCLIGTTALLHREVGDLDLVVVDEEQKFSVEQREALTGLGAHMLSATATCIPRTMALARFGAVSVSTILKSPVDKSIETRMWLPEDRRDLFADLREFLDAGSQLLVIYPRREARKCDDPDAIDLHSIAAAHQGWSRMFPDRVMSLDASDDDARKADVLKAMRDDKASVLIATTVVEVGITIPGLRRIVIVSPELMGLSQIHQLRGRVARLGGQGWCDLFSPAGLNDAQTEKLAAFLDCKNGYEVAELDLSLRGFGDLSIESTEQSGSDNAILFGAALTPAHVAPMEGLWKKVNGVM